MSKNGKKINCMTLLIVGLMTIWFICDGEKTRRNWEITQYSDVSGNQGSFYTISNKNKGILIVVDGGWSVNAGMVRNAIENNGGHVTAWILTHYHEDHIGAFNALWHEYKGRINKVYISPFDYESFRKSSKSWDTPEAYDTFWKETKDATCIQELYRDDKIQIDELLIHVYNSFDEEVIKRTADWPNNCSLVFMISTKQESMLYLGDMSDQRMGDYLLERYGADELHANYVQAAHHGNWGQNAGFYQQIHPKVMLFDAPESLLNIRTEDRYDAYELLHWCEINRIKTMDFRTAPNRIILR